jgi:thiol:disulfide interchange protein DsbD
MKVVVLTLLAAASLFGQAQHVKWSVEPDANAAGPGGKTLVKVTATPDSGWHIYSGSTAGGKPTSFTIEPMAPAIERLRMLQPAAKRAYDANFGTETETYEGSVTFLLELQLAKDAPLGSSDHTLNARFQVCNASECDPGKWQGSFPLTIAAGAASAPAIPAGYSEAKPPPAAGAAGVDTENWGTFLLVAFGLGVASIFTPCVFPMIPITMSFFLNKKGSVSQAVVFCLGIVVLFSGIGLVVTLILGPAGVVALGQNAWVNGFIAALFVVFGLSLLGAFEITIPSGILTKLNQSSEGGGFVGTLLMGLTFSLASFACVGPFVGTLLAASVTQGAARPLAGMATFAAGLAAPFFLLALFPGYLKKMPRSGGWLARVKVVMGFIVLAFSIKYLSSVDQVLRWDFITRERFLAIWIVLFAAAGLYLLGLLRLEGVKSDDTLGVGRLVIGLAFVAFAISLAPGIGGGKLGDLDAFVPLGPERLMWMKDQYRQALDRARAEGRLVLVDFTGYACTNCHWMKANMFTRPEIETEMQKFVLVELYADGGDATSDANSKLEQDKFQTIAEPFYAIMRPDESVVATSSGLTRDPAVFAAFLQKSANVAVAAATDNGTQVPHLTTLDGSPIETAGKVVVLDFWATWCVPCIAELPTFNQLYKELGSKGVVIVGVNMDDDASAIPSFLKKHPIEYPVAKGTDDLNDKFQIGGYPTTLVFDRNGKLVKRFGSDADIAAMVKQSL